MLPAQWIRDVNNYQRNGVPKKLKVVISNTQRAIYYGGDLHTMHMGIDSPHSTYLHEFMHAVQQVRPDIDKIVQEFHIKQTTNEKGKREPVRLLPTNEAGVTRKGESGRKDHYPDAYYGRQYNNDQRWIPIYEGDEGAYEVLTMSTQQVLKGDKYTKNPFYALKKQEGGHGKAIIDLVLGLLTGL